MPRRGDLIVASKLDGEAGDRIVPYYGIYYGLGFTHRFHTAWVAITPELTNLRRNFGEGARLNKFRILVPLEFM